MPPNQAKALEYYRRSADGADAEGMYYLALCYAEGKAVEPDRKEALRICRDALACKDLEEQDNPGLREKLEALAARLKA